jgi:hypothetical protein
MDIMKRNMRTRGDRLCIEKTVASRKKSFCENTWLEIQPNKSDLPTLVITKGKDKRIINFKDKTLEPSPASYHSSYLLNL